MKFLWRTLQIRRMFSEHIDATFGSSEVPVLLRHKRLDTSAIYAKQNHDSTNRVKKIGSDYPASVVDPGVNSCRDFLARFEQQPGLQEERVRKLVSIQEEILRKLELSRFRMFKHYNSNDSLLILDAILK